MYAPNNIPMFTAVFSGAYAGMTVSDRIPTSVSPSNPFYVTSALVAGAFAIALDTQWGARATTDLDIQLGEALSQEIWEQRASPTSDTQFQFPFSHTAIASTLIAMITTAENYFAAQGIVPPSPPTSTGESVVVYPFTFATPSPTNLGAIVAGSTFNRALVLVTVPFDDITATLSLGPASAPTALLAPSDSRLFVADQYDSGAVVQSLGADFLLLTLSPGTSTMGSGLLLWKVLP